MYIKKSLSVLVLAAFCTVGLSAEELNISGKWQFGKGRIYSETVDVPGIHTDPATVGKDTLWYRKSVTLPCGDWTNAMIELKGARFRPAVYVNGVLMSEQEGGMIRSFHDISSKMVTPGATVTLEVRLCPLGSVPPADASFIPKVDQWRSNCAACLWDDVIIHTYSGRHLDRVLTYTDHEAKTVTLKYRIIGEKQTPVGDTPSSGRVRITISSKEAHNNQPIAPIILEGPSSIGESAVSFSYAGKLSEWSPDHPSCYDLKAEIMDHDGKVLDTYCQTFAPKEFKTSGIQKQFILNGDPITLRGGTIVWHRWMRDPEGREVGWDCAWLEQNIIRRLKESGANYLRFHLGVPPEAILDLCDKYGLAVQYEWNFFHGMPASYESLMEQYPKWLDLASRHPSVTLYHPYNETEGEQLATVWRALDKITLDYPPLVMEERDVIHVHKYWWSLFENIGIYYDSAQQFEKPIMVDEFGGNYLDGKGEMGLYPSIRESYMRFLGPSHTAEQRLAHLDRSCARIAEYWRRIGAAGIAPFTIASSQEDGCNWFMGRLKDGNPKSVWDALAVLWSPVAISIDIWDSNFVPGQQSSIPVHFFNDTAEESVLKGTLSILDQAGNIISSSPLSARLEAHSHNIQNISVSMPLLPGNYKIRAELLERPDNIKPRVLSDWDIRVLSAKMPEQLLRKKVFIPAAEKELIQMSHEQGLRLTHNISRADVALYGAASWPLSAQTSGQIEKAIAKGTSVVILDIGEKNLGQGYPDTEGDMGPLQGVKKVINGRQTHYPLFLGLSLNCTEMAEPESYIHPVANSSDMRLWRDMPKECTGIWNGLRGGLLVPASDIELEGLSNEAFLNHWSSRGADKDHIIKGDYYAYNLCGFYAYDSRPDNKQVIAELRRKVAFLIEDAPALAMSLNAKAPVQVTDLGKGYMASLSGRASSFEPLACCGKNLTRIPVMLVHFGDKDGRVVFSQLITSGRLAKEADTPSSQYGIRYDEGAVQTVLNMLATVVE